MHKSIISASTLAANLEHPEWRIIDCRFNLADTEAGRAAYEASHLPGALYAHLDEHLSGPILPGITGRHPMPDADALANFLSGCGVAAGVQVVVYDDRAGGVAARLWWLLRWLGHEAVAVLDGGWAAWQAAGYPVSADIPVPARHQFVAKPNPEMVVDADEVAVLSQDADFVVADARAPERYSGEVEPIDPVAGHIPGAINYPFLRNLDEQGHFLPPAMLREQLEASTAHRPASQVAFYCGSGVTACHNALAFVHAGMGMPKIYPGSWSEWITDEKRGIARG